MATFRIYDGEELVNLIRAKSKEIAEQVTGLTAVEVVPIQPFPSWIFNEEREKWLPPTPYPDDDLSYNWNEELGDWEVIVFDDELAVE